MNDLISREDAIKLFLERKNELSGIQGDLGGAMSGAVKLIESLPSAEPKDWMEQNKDKILQAGKEGREVEFRIDGRLFAIREKAQ